MYVVVSLLNEPFFSTGNAHGNWIDDPCNFTSPLHSFDGIMIKVDTPSGGLAP
jgi:hypothetical protein